MIVKSLMYRVVGFKGNRSTAPFFKDVKEDDVLQLEINMGTRVSYGVSKMVTIKNLSTNASRTDNTSNINKGLEKLELQEQYLVATAGC